MKKIIIIYLYYFYFGILYSYSQSNILTRDYEVNIENDAVHQYMVDVIYEPHGLSVIDNYRKDLQYRGDWPRPVMVDLPEFNTDSLLIVCCDDETLNDSLTFHVSTENKTAQLYNFIPNRTYRYQIKDDNDVLQQGKIETKGQLRMIKVCNTVNNVRDIGGWKTIDNKQIRYGKIFRGSDLNGTHIATEEGINVLRELGVGAELDLRAWYNAGNNTSAFGFSSNFSSEEVARYFYSSNSGQLPSHMSNYTWQSKWRQEFQFIINNLRQGRCIYEHCVQGKDRTGFLSFLLEGLLGVPYSELVKDYELTFFIYGTNIKSTKDTIDKVFDYIDTMDGETLRDKFNTYFINKIRVEQSDIDYFRDNMLEAIKPEDAAIQEASTILKKKRMLLQARISLILKCLRGLDHTFR